MHETTVEKLMTSPVEALRPTAKPSEARRILMESTFHHLPVADDDGKVVGMVSTTDLLNLSCEAYGVDGEVMNDVMDRHFTLAEVMRPPRVVTKGSSLRDAAKLLSTGNIHSLPVVDDEGRLHGILTSTDLIAYLLDALEG